MPVMTILSCKILQDEIVHLFENDPCIDEITVIKNNEEKDFLTKLDNAGLKYSQKHLKDMPYAVDREDREKYIVMVYLVELALHEFPKILREEVYRLLENVTPYSDGILLFYGLCGNVLDKVEEDFRHQESTCPVRILRDDKRIVDDCVGATLGGGEEYLKILKKFSDKGTFLFTPMFAHSWREIMRVDPVKPEKTLKMLRKVNEITGYKRVAKIHTRLGYTPDFDKNVEEFARIFDFEIHEVEGNQQIFRTCYAAMKKDMGLIDIQPGT
ncbi:DUF1638 domain-containing protein [Methanolobus halotolerans]|uniref:DUF1638 domain-containing protein n=1 Tax=Methanolobus halotolerans TaxID=2052935 RepID=A0A4E0Q3A4_9EURY|nr:DUF1638 domain-containing protein [Methanolobus halotolerans]TGC07504.1 hypothetical protein CUN85_10975 [Methanolobus halotolerans]